MRNACTKCVLLKNPSQTQNRKQTWAALYLHSTRGNTFVTMVTTNTQYKFVMSFVIPLNSLLKFQPQLFSHLKDSHL